MSARIPTVPLSFRYPAADGSHREITIHDWQESTRYILASVDGEPVSFRKDLMCPPVGGTLPWPAPAMPPLPGPAQRVVELCLDGFGDTLEHYLAQIDQRGYAVYRAGKGLRLDRARCTPGFLLRAGETKRLDYYICARPSLRTQTVRQLQAAGVLVQGAAQFLALLDHGVLPADEPEWPPSAVAIPAPRLDGDGNLEDWAFALGRWAFVPLGWRRSIESVSGEDLGWVQDEVPAYAFADATVFNLRAGGVSLQVESAVAGHKGWVVLKRYHSNCLHGRYRCRQWELAALLRDGDLSRLQPLAEEAVT